MQSKKRGKDAMEAIHQNRLVLLSRNIFTATGDTPFDGFIAIEGNKIILQRMGTAQPGRGFHRNPLGRGGNRSPQAVQPDPTRGSAAVRPLLGRRSFRDHRRYPAGSRVP